MSVDRDDRALHRRDRDRLGLRDVAEGGRNPPPNGLEKNEAQTVDTRVASPSR